MAKYLVYKKGQFVCSGNVAVCSRATGLSISRIYSLVTHSKKHGREDNPRVKYTVTRMEEE